MFVKGGCKGAVLKGDLSFLAERRVAWRHQVPGRKSIDAEYTSEYTESQARSKTVGGQPQAGYFKERVQSGGKFPV